MTRVDQKGQAMVEYAVVCALVGLALSWGEPDVIDRLVDAWNIRLNRFTAALAEP